MTGQAPSSTQLPTEEDLRRLANAEAVKFTPPCDGIFKRNPEKQAPFVMPEGVEMSVWSRSKWVKDRIFSKIHGSGTTYMTAYAVWKTFCDCCKEGSWMTAAGQKKVARIAGCNTRTVKRVVKYLRSIGLLSTKWRYTINKYGLPWKTTSITTITGFFRIATKEAKKQYNKIRSVKPVVNAAPAQQNPIGDTASPLLSYPIANSSQSPKMPNLPPDIMEAFKDFIGVPA